MSKIYEQLKENFKEDALSADTSRGFALTSIKPQYIKERLNEVVGIDGWRLTGEYKEVDKGVVFFGTLTIAIGDKMVSHEAPGFSENKRNLGDTYKSAQTDSLSKCASFFGIGNEVFKGNVAPPSGKTSTTKPANATKFTASKKSASSIF